MSGFPWQPRPTFPPATWGLVLLVAGLVVLALGGLLFVLALTGGNSRVTSEAYIYNLFVRVRNPGAIAELWVPMPDFPELSDRTSRRRKFRRLPQFERHPVHDRVAVRDDVSIRFLRLVRGPRSDGRGPWFSERHLDFQHPGLERGPDLPGESQLGQSGVPDSAL